MKPHPRIRKMVKWGGAVVTALLLVVWVGSGWWEVGWVSREVFALTHRKPMGITVGSGVVALDTLIDPNGDDGRFPGWRATHGSFEITWGFTGGMLRSGWLVQVPIWSLALLFGAVSTWAWTLEIIGRRRKCGGRCPKCGYDRAGIAAGVVCPECGTLQS